MTHTDKSISDIKKSVYLGCDSASMCSRTATCRGEFLTSSSMVEMSYRRCWLFKMRTCIFFESLRSRFVFLWRLHRIESFNIRYHLGYSKNLVFVKIVCFQTWLFRTNTAPVLSKSQTKRHNFRKQEVSFIFFYSDIQVFGFS